MGSLYYTVLYTILLYNYIRRLLILYRVVVYGVRGIYRMHFIAKRHLGYTASCSNFPYIFLFLFNDYIYRSGKISRRLLVEQFEN